MFEDINSEEVVQPLNPEDFTNAIKAREQKQAQEALDLVKRAEETKRQFKEALHKDFWINVKKKLEANLFESNEYTGHKWYEMEFSIFAPTDFENRINDIEKIDYLLDGTNWKNVTFESDYMNDSAGEEVDFSNVEALLAPDPKSLYKQVWVVRLYY